MKKKYMKLQDDLSREVSRYVDSLPPPDTTTQTDKPETIEIPEGTSTAKHN
jgi:hypothetical protein